jgi:hypothetical protein
MRLRQRNVGFTLVIGCKGGVGATTVALELVKAWQGVGLDGACGQLAARLERPAWMLSQIAFSPAAQRRLLVDDVVRRRPTILWTGECSLAAEQASAFVRAVADRAPVVGDVGTGNGIVADGGLEPNGLASQAETIVVVTAEGDVAQWHTKRLLARFPGALTVSGTREAARALAAQLTQGE